MHRENVELKEIENNTRKMNDWFEHFRNKRIGMRQNYICVQNYRFLYGTQ